MSGGIEELGEAVVLLEAALKSQRERHAEEQGRMQALRAEVDALRRVQGTVAGRLDAVIARLQAALGD